MESKEQILKRVIDPVTVSVYQALNNIELLQSSDNADIKKYLYSCIKKELEKALEEYIRTVEK